MRQISFDSIYPNPENLASICPDDAVPEFDLPRTNADRVVLALRSPSRPDAEPLSSVTKVITDRVWWLIVYDPDVLEGLLRMGWMDGGARDE